MGVYVCVFMFVFVRVSMCLICSSWLMASSSFYNNRKSSGIETKRESAFMKFKLHK